MLNSRKLLMLVDNVTVGSSLLQVVVAERLVAVVEDNLVVIGRNLVEDSLVVVVIEHNLVEDNLVVIEHDLVEDSLVVKPLGMVVLVVALVAVAENTQMD